MPLGPLQPLLGGGDAGVEPAHRQAQLGHVPLGGLDTGIETTHRLLQLGHTALRRGNAGIEAGNGLGQGGQASVHLLDGGFQLPVRRPELLLDVLHPVSSGGEEVRHIVAHLHPDGVAVERVIGDGDDPCVHRHTHGAVGDVHLVPGFQISHLEQRNFIGLRILPAVQGDREISHILAVHENFADGAAPVFPQADLVAVILHFTAAGVNESHESIAAVQRPLGKGHLHIISGFAYTNGERSTGEQPVQAAQRRTLVDKGDEVVLLVIEQIGDVFALGCGDWQAVGDLPCHPDDGVRLPLQPCRHAGEQLLGAGGQDGEIQRPLPGEPVNQGCRENAVKVIQLGCPLVDVDLHRFLLPYPTPRFRT